MQKSILKKQYKNFVTSRSEGLVKTYDTFQKLISQLEIHGGHAYHEGEEIHKENWKESEFQCSKDKTGLGYDNHLTKRDLSNKSDVFESAYDSSVNESEEDDNQANDRYKACEGYHAVPPPYIGNFMPSRPDLSFCRESDSDDDCEIRPSIEQNKPSHAKINFVKSDKNTRKSVIEQHTYKQDENLGKSQNSRSDKRNWNGMMTQRLGNGFEKEFCSNISDNKLRIPNLDFMKPFGCLVTILNTLDHLGKFKWKADEGFLVGYFVNSKAFRVFNSRNMRVEENLHMKFLENKPNVEGRDLEWLFDIDLRTYSMNYKPVTTANQTNNDASIEINDNVGKVGKEKASNHEYILLLFMPSSTKSSDDKDVGEELDKGDEGVSKGSGIVDQEKTNNITQDVGATEPSINTASKNINTSSLNINIVGPNDPSIPSLEETGIFVDVYDDREVGLQVKQKDDGIFISQDKYVAYSFKKFDFTTMKTASTPMEPNNTLIKDAEAEDVDVHLYRSMIRSLMYLIASRPELMFAICACARFQVTPKTSHLHAMKRIFIYLKEQPKLGLWYPRDSPFNLEAFSDSDYSRASLDRKSTTGGCHFLGKRLISWQCKKQTIVANSTTEAEYVVAASCYGQIWTSAKVKTVNDDVQLQALIDGKKVVVNEASIRRDLRLDDAEGTTCLPNAAIFEELA
nr:uncharacterized mitochondrial protein AtMg00810-like [Tanacetum cinerariifolium]